MIMVPRWEWRAFAESFGGAENHLAALAGARVEVSDETYLLAPRSDASVKVRAGRMDVKGLLQVDAAGLEQWAPALKAPFPLSRQDARAVVGALDETATLDQEAYTLEHLLAAMPGVRRVDVHKERRRGTLGDCMAEVTTLRTSAGTARTIAIEDEDPARVRAVVDELGLASRHVVCVARGLKALHGLGARRYAVVDVGTNSVKLHVGERASDGTWRHVADRAVVTRLGEGVDATGRLTAAAIGRTVEAIAVMVAEARALAAEETACVGTAALRAAANAAALRESVAARCGVDVEVIPAVEEARLAYLAATAALLDTSGSSVVFDTGGGSSQFTYGESGRIADRFSLRVGAARYTEQHGLDTAVSTGTVAEALAAIEHDLAPLAGRPRPRAVVGMGGAVTNLAAVSQGLATYDPQRIQGATLTRAEIDEQIELYRTRTAAERRDVIGLQRDRAEVILAGACIVATVLVLLGRDAIVVSDRALRHGVLEERFALGPPVPAHTMSLPVAATVD
jgi:exopolyphosphatase/guanosine-5'-triphosphate,3'-diphosphate pyrophosphatase